MSELKLCPFCGSEAEVITHEIGCATYFDIGCTKEDCYLYGGAEYTFGSEIEAKEKWNTRPESSTFHQQKADCDCPPCGNECDKGYCQITDKVCNVNNCACLTCEHSQCPPAIALKKQPWTAEAPTQEGWYWYRNRRIETIIRVKNHKGFGMGTTYFDGSHGFISVDELAGEDGALFQGPLKPGE